MLFWREIKIAINLGRRNLLSSPGRTFLSLLGIVIGTASVVLVLSLGAGVKNYIVEQIQSFGTDIIQVEIKVPKTQKNSSQGAAAIAGGTTITTFKLEEAEKIGTSSEIEAWYAGIMSQQIVKYSGQNKQALIMGVSAGAIETDKQLIIAEGRMFSAEEDASLNQSVVIGSDFKKDFFPNETAIGKKVKIKGKDFQIIGVLAERGSTGFFNFDNLIYLPIQTLQKKILGIDHIQFAIFKVRQKEKIALMALYIEDQMRRLHNIQKEEDEDYAVTSISEATGILDQIFQTINILLVALASISLLVGGVGIMNVLYVAVAERTFEIGLYKSIGARQSAILKLFLFEAFFLTILGSIGGLLLGWLGTLSAGWIASFYGFYLRFPFTLENALFSFLFSGSIGIIFGLKPAWKASQLSPIEAMRKE